MRGKAPIIRKKIKKTYKFHKLVTHVLNNYSLISVLKFERRVPFMKHTCRAVWVSAAFSLLLACGGGSAVTSDITPQKAPAQSSEAAVTAPVSTSTADLLAFAKGGSTSILHDDVLRITRESGGNAVVYDSVAGSNTGLLMYSDADGDISYRVTEEAHPDVVIGSGIYTGPMEMTYSTTSSGALKNAVGDLRMSIDFEKGTVSTDGLAGNSINNLQVFGSGVIKDGQFQDDKTTIRLLDGQGNFIQDYTGSTSGVLTNGAEGRDAVVGTLLASDLRMTGGYIVNENLSQ